MKIKTNTAIIELNDEGNVEKKFKIKNQAYKEYISLVELERIFTSKCIKGWYFDVSHPIKLEISNNTIIMTLASGKDKSRFLEIDEKDVILFSIWLAEYHKEAKTSNGKVKKIGDYHRGNILIDDINNKVTVIDPGPYYKYKDVNSREDLGLYFGEVGFKEEDLIPMIYSLFIGSVKTFNNPYSYIELFIKEYEKYNESFNLDTLNCCWNSKRNKYLKKRFRYNHIFRFISLVGLVTVNISITMLLNILSYNCKKKKI